MKLYNTYHDYAYYFKVNNLLKQIKLKEIQKNYLRYFALYPFTSPYRIGKEETINESGQRITKLNTNLYTKSKIISRQLYNLKLIDYHKIDKEKDPHKKKNYYLTELGVYHIMKDPIFLKINIQYIIKKYPNLKIFQDLLYPFIQKDTLCSPKFPEDILAHICSFLQKQYLKIEKFCLDTENKTDWNEKRLILNEGKLQNYLIEKFEHKYKWLESSDTERDDEGRNIKFFNHSNPKIFLEVRLREDGILIFFMDGIKKKKYKKIIEKIQMFQTEISFSKKEAIGNAFISCYSCNSFEFISSLLPAFHIFNFDIANLFLKDKCFIKSFDEAKKEFCKIYESVKNPYKYSRESIIQKELLGGYYSNDFNS